MSQSIQESSLQGTGVLARLSENGQRLLVAGGVALLALALRWPYLMLVPRLTDETAEISWAWQIAQGEMLPLTHVDPYYGIVHPYLLAGLFNLFGPHIVLPRALNAIAGALLAALVAWVAWGMAARTTTDHRPPTTNHRPPTTRCAGGRWSTHWATR